MGKLNPSHIADILALTPVQKGILFHYLRTPGSTFYFEQLTVELGGTPDIERFKQAWNHVIKSNGMLRTRFQWEQVKEPVQVVLKSAPLQFEYIDLSGQKSADTDTDKDTYTDAALEELKKNDKKRGFDLRRVPFRVTLCHMGEKGFRMLVSHHHILYDGWSNSTILKEFFDAYNEISAGKEPVLTPKTPFKEYIKWRKQRDTKKIDQYWRDYFRDFRAAPATACPAVSSLQTEKPPELTNSTNWPNSTNSPNTGAGTGRAHLKLPESLVSQINAFVKWEKTTLATLLYCAWGLVLQAYENSNDILFDTTLSGRPGEIQGIESMVGLCIETVPVRLRTGQESFRQLLQRLGRALNETERIGSGPVGHIPGYSDRMDQAALQTVVAVENYPLDIRSMTSPETQPALKPLSFEADETTRYDITVIIQAHDGIAIDFSYAQSRFEAEDFHLICQSFRETAAQMVWSPSSTVPLYAKAHELNRNRAPQDIIEPLLHSRPKEQPAIQAGIETTLRALWADVFQVPAEKLGPETSFMELTGHSLKAVSLATAIQRKFNVNLSLNQLFQRHSIRTQAEFIRELPQLAAAPTASPGAVAAAEKKDYYPLSPAQKRLFILWQMDQAGTAYNGPEAFIIKGEPDVRRLRESFSELTRRHESLRTTFHVVKGTPVQRITPLHLQPPVPVEFHEDERNENVVREALEDFIRPFDLNRGPLMRVRMDALTGGRYVLAVDIHHIVVDGFSTEILMREFKQLYEGHGLPMPRFQYKDYVDWFYRRGNIDFDGQETYWLERFKERKPAPRFYTDFPPPEESSEKAERLLLDFTPETSRGLKQVAADNGATVYVLLLTVFNVLLWKYTGGEEVIIGTPTLGRSLPEHQNLVGMLVNTLALRNFPTAEKSFESFLKEVKEHFLSDLENQDYPFEQLVERLGLQGGGQGNGLFNTWINAPQTGENPGQEMTIGDMTWQPFPLGAGATKFDLSLYIEEQGEQVQVGMEYKTCLFRRETVEYLLAQLGSLVEQVVDCPQKPLSAYQLMQPQPIPQSPVLPAASFDVFEGQPNIVRRFEQMVKRAPDHPAIRCADAEEQSLTYGELNRWSNRIAHTISNTREILKPQENVTVALLFSPHPAMIAAILGTLKAGACYAPLDPSFPIERQQRILEDSGAGLILTHQPHETQATELVQPSATLSVKLPVINTDSLETDNETTPAVTISPDQGAYLLYTSGSTGKPKGVKQSHRYVLHHMRVFSAYSETGPADQVPLVSNYAYDGAVIEMFLALLNGAGLTLPATEAESATDRQTTFLNNMGATREILRGSTRRNLNGSTRRDLNGSTRRVVFHATPTYYRHILQNLEPGETLAAVRMIMLGGEAVTVDDVDLFKKHFAPDCLFFNNMGMTESTANLQFMINRETALTHSFVPLGSPPPGTRVSLLNDEGEEVPVFGIGELVLDSPLLTHFKTGDLVRRHPDGQLQFIGRKDYQVKIRGFRVDTSEIETVLKTCPGIEDAVVVCKKNQQGESFLAAYLISGETMDSRSQSDYLTRKLPEYMVPAPLIRVDRFPLTVNDKIDRLALALRPLELIINDETYSAPVNENERQLARIWSPLVNREPGAISRNDNFFRLGGHSLSAVALITAIHEQLNVKPGLADIFANPTLSQMARFLGQRTQAAHDALPPAETRQYYPLSPAQKRIYVLQQTHPESTAYHLSSFHYLDESADVEKISAVFSQLLQRHQVLRTSFLMHQGQPVQRIAPYDTANPQAASQEITIQHTTPENFVRPFDLTRAPLLRIGIGEKPGAPGKMLLLDIHHIICDGLSMRVLIKDFLTLYEGENPPPLPAHYKDYVMWQQGETFQARLKDQEAFWLNQFPRSPQPLELPLDFPRPVVRSVDGSAVDFTVEKELLTALETLAQTNDVTLYMILLAVFYTLLAKLGGQEEIVVGTPTGGRKNKELLPLLGMFVNTLALRCFPADEKSFGGFLPEVKETAIQAFENQDFPFETLVEKLKVENTGRNPVFDVMFSFQQHQEQRELLHRSGVIVPCEDYRLASHSSKFDMTLYVFARSAGLDCSLEYCSALFRRATVQRFSGYYLNILRNIAQSPDTLISAIDYISPEEKQKILVEFNDTDADFPYDKTIIQLFDEQARRTPDHIAICSSHSMHCSHISYNRLNQKTDEVALDLIQKGVRPENIVAIKMERSLEMMVTLIGIVKAGAAYLPIDPAYPRERIDYLMKDSNAVFLLESDGGGRDVDHDCGCGFGRGSGRGNHAPTHNTPAPANGAGAWSPRPATYDNENENPTPTPNQLCYTIYTSGSTGKPKGVLVEHRALVNRLHWMQHAYPIGPGDAILQKTPTTFDVSLWELFWWSITGATLCLLEPGGEKNPQAMLDTIQRHHVTTMHFVPSMLNVFLEYTEKTDATSKLKSLNRVFASGEALLPHHVKQFNQLLYKNNNTTLINLYGPTEATVDVSYYNCRPREGYSIPDNIPIGKPIQNIRLYILSKTLQPQATGITGELHIAGTGLARGYLNRPELTADKFISMPPAAKGAFLKNCPFGNPQKLLLARHGNPTTHDESQQTFNKSFSGSPEGQFFKNAPLAAGGMYKTGDLARWMPDGNIQFLGRIDHQVKIRGFRIELGEIEDRLVSYEGVKEAVVVARAGVSGAGRYLCAYVVSHGGEDLSERLREHLGRSLPDYMVPAYFVHLDQLPLTGSKKIDRKALPEPVMAQLPAEREYLPPRSELEKKIADAWESVLEIEKVGIHDNFFQLGGNSLNIIQLSTALKESLGRDVPVVELYRYLTVNELARHLESLQKKSKPASKPVQRKPIEKQKLDRGKKLFKNTIQKTMLNKKRK